jgi:hypothetical protein
MLNSRDSNKIIMQREREKTEYSVLGSHSWPANAVYDNDY